MRWQKYNSELVKESFDAIVIGSGIGGMATAALLAKENKRVLVLEKHYEVGGLTHTFQRKKYQWDIGLHYIGGGVHEKNSVTNILYNYICDGKLEWEFMGEIYDRFFFPNRDYSFRAGRKNLRDGLVNDFPKEQKAIDKYFDLIQKTEQAMGKFWQQKYVAKCIAPFTYPFLTKDFLKFAKQTTIKTISSLTKNQELVGLLTSQWPSYGIPPSQSSFGIHAPLVAHYFDGGSYPLGGSLSFAKNIIPVVQRSGGMVLIKAEVEKVLVRKRTAIGVKLSNGDEIYSPMIISAVGAFNTFTKMLEPENTKKNILRQLTKIPRTSSHLCLYLGLKESSSNLNLPKTNYWVYPGYNHDENTQNFARNPNAEFPVLFFSFPSAKDPLWEKHHGKTSTIEVITFVPYMQFQKWENTKWKKRGSEYEAIKEKYTQKILHKLYELLPQVKNKIDHCELSTPLSTKHFTNYSKGEVYGLDHTPKRFQQKWLHPRTAIKNLYLTGQDVTTDGISGALFSGYMTASILLKKDMITTAIQKST